MVRHWRSSCTTFLSWRNVEVYIKSCTYQSLILNSSSDLMAVHRVKIIDSHLLLQPSSECLGPICSHSARNHSNCCTRHILLSSIHGDLAGSQTCKKIKQLLIHIFFVLYLLNLTLSPPNKLLSAKFLVCFHFQNASMSLKVGENAVRMLNSLDMGETLSYSLSCLNMEILFCLAGYE